MHNFVIRWPTFKLFQRWIQQDICNKYFMLSTTRYIYCYTTLWNLKYHLYHLPTTAVRITYIGSHLFLKGQYYCNMLLTQQQVATACHARSVVSLLLCQLTAQPPCYSVFHFNFSKWETPTFRRVGCGPNTQIWIQWTTKFIQKCISGSIPKKSS